MNVRILIVMLLGCVAASARARPDNVLMLGGGHERPQRVVVTIGDTLPDPLPAPSSPMLELLDGVIADLSGADLGRFLGTPVPRTKLIDARGNLERIGVAHLIGKHGEKRVELLSGNEGVFLAQEMESEAPGESPRVAKLDPERFRAVSLGWARYRGPIEEASGEGQSETDRAKPGVLVEMAKPYSQGPFFLDQETLGDRFLRGRRSNIPGVARILKDETMYARLPRGYDPKHPAGLLVWISAAQDGRVPEAFVPAADELGIIAVGIRDVGNDRPVADRYQLALDAMWTASRRYHVDPRRVYLSGISGGGRIASMLEVCFADYFTGAVPIVGLSTYVNVPVGNGVYKPAGYQHPEPKVWAYSRTRRMATITGDRDFNTEEIQEATKIMAGDGMPVRFFSYDKMGHEMPTPERFTEALKWVDEGYEKAREKEEAAAKSLMDKYVERRGKRGPSNALEREELVKITETAPWSATAWDAVALLRAKKD